MHCLVHLVPSDVQAKRFPAIHNIKTSPPNSPEHYGVVSMVVWSTIPYALWQLTYHLLITVRRREKIAAGRPTSFTWLRKSYAGSWLGRMVLSLPDALQEPAFMFIQYGYALLTMLPAPIWFWFRWPSALFLFSVFTWSVYNGANYYLDVFGMRFQKELEAIKRDVAIWQTSPDITAKTPGSEGAPGTDSNGARFSLGDAAVQDQDASKRVGDDGPTNHAASTGAQPSTNAENVVKRNAT